MAAWQASEASSLYPPVLELLDVVGRDATTDG